MTALRQLRSAAATTIYDAVERASSPDHLDDLARTLWRGYGKGVISDADATFLQDYIARRRPPGRLSAVGHLRSVEGPLSRAVKRMGSRFTPRQRPRCPNRQASRERRRTLGGSSALPANLRHHYTEGQRAVLCIIAGEIKRHGICDLPIDKIGALAGVCRTTVQTTLHEARRLGHIDIAERPQPGRKQLPNIVTITSREWSAWLKRGPSAARGLIPIGSKVVNLVSTTKNKVRKKDWTYEEKRAPERANTMAAALAKLRDEADTLRRRATG